MSYHKFLTISCKQIIVAFLLLAIIPYSQVLASGFGGYISSSLVGMSGVDDSQLLIGRSNTSGSLFDIGVNSVEGSPSTHMNVSDSSFILTTTLPVIFLSIVILMLVAFIMTRSFSLPFMILAVILIFLGVAGMEAIQSAINALLH